MLHDAQDLGPGAQELVEAHRLGRPEPDEVWRTTFDVPRRGYRLLLGLRRPEAWSALRPRAIDASIVEVPGIAVVHQAFYRVGITHHESFEPPLLTQNVGEQPAIASGRYIVEIHIGAHCRADSGPHGSVKRGKIDVLQLRL